MPAPVLNAAARITCVHGGQVTVIPKQAQVLVGGAPALCVGDLIGSPIVDCPVPPTPATKPCTIVASEIPIPGAGMSLTAKALGKPLLLQGVSGITDGVPPGPILVISAGQAKVLA